MRKLKRVNESKNKIFDNFLYYLIEELNHIFNQKGFWHLTDEGNYYLAVIEHDNGSKIEIHDESVDGNDKINLVVVYPNNRSKWIGEFYQEEITDIADKMYEYAVVKNTTKQEGVKPMIRRKRVNEEFSPNSLEDCRQRIKRLLKFASATTYSAIGNEDALVLDSGEYLEAVYLFEDGNSRYLQYEPSSGKVVTNYRNLSYREVAEILENIENDNI